MTKRRQTATEARLEMALHNLAEMRRMYHELALKLAESPAAPPVESFPEPELPPREVLDAMQQISPVRDKTYEANWAFWERNKEEARLYPQDFAEKILLGATFEPEHVS